MLVLSETLGADDTSAVLFTTADAKAWIRLAGTFSAQTVTMEQSVDNTTWATFSTDGTAQQFTSADYKLYDLPGGVYFRFDVTNGGTPDIDIHYSGAAVRVVS